MKYAIYEDPATHQFAHLPLPKRYVDGDALPTVSADRWFDSRADAIAALAELLNRDEDDVVPAADQLQAPLHAAPAIAASPRWPVLWSRH